MANDQKTLIDWFAENPRVGLVGTIASIVGLLLAIYFFLASERTRNIRYANSSPTTIVKSGQSSDLRVQFKNQELTGDVNSIQLVIWNDGKESVKRDNILSGVIYIDLGNSASILEARVKRVTRDLIGFDIKAGKKPWVLNCDWNILEAGDGAMLEVIYTGYADVRVMGDIEGRVPIEQIGGSLLRGDLLSNRQLALEGVSFVAITMTLFFMGSNQNRIEKLRGAVMFALSVCFLIIIAMDWYNRHTPPSIPFAF